MIPRIGYVSHSRGGRPLTWLGPVAHSNLRLTTFTQGSLQAGQVYTRGVLSPVLGLRWLTPDRGLLASLFCANKPDSLRNSSTLLP